MQEVPAQVGSCSLHPFLQVPCTHSASPKGRTAKAGSGRVARLTSCLSPSGGKQHEAEPTSERNTVNANGPTNHIEHPVTCVRDKESDVTLSQAACADTGTPGRLC